MEPQTIILLRNVILNVAAVVCLILNGYKHSFKYKYIHTYKYVYKLTNLREHATQFRRVRWLRYDRHLFRLN